MAKKKHKPNMKQGNRHRHFRHREREREHTFKHTAQRCPLIKCLPQASQQPLPRFWHVITELSCLVYTTQLIFKSVSYKRDIIIRMNISYRKTYSIIQSRTNTHKVEREKKGEFTCIKLDVIHDCWLTDLESSSSELKNRDIICKLSHQTQFNSYRNRE